MLKFQEWWMGAIVSLVAAEAGITRVDAGDIRQEGGLSS